VVGKTAVNEDGSTVTCCMTHSANPADKVSSYRLKVQWQSVAGCLRNALPVKTSTEAN